ncbi:MAG: MBOAT family protein [Desulfamplus sp.]|nr:MBOAT family protein [Desulfamplus sp.]
MLSSVRLRTALLAVSSFCALFLLVKLQTTLLILLLSQSLWVIFGLRLSYNRGRKKPYTASLILFLPLLIMWLICKTAVTYQNIHLKVLFFIGVSYLLIKSWTLIKDVYDGRIEPPNALTAIAFFSFFPTYISGPMHYYKEFEESLQHPNVPNTHDFVDIAYRFLLGLVKIKVIASLFQPFSLTAVVQAGGASVSAIILGAFAYSIVIYADFSGYSDLAISTARLFGIYTPENFNNPYFSSNIREFWQIWHVSFTRVLTSYIFIPLSRTLQKKWPRNPQNVMVISYLLTFGFCGYWHGPTSNFFFWGIYHATGLILYDLYRAREMKHRLNRGRMPSRKFSTTVHKFSGTICTFCFVSIGWIWFVMPLPMILQSR